MNYPLDKVYTGLRNAILAKLPARNVLTVPPKGLVYPYIWLSQPYMSEVGPKSSFMYEIEILIQIVHRELSSLTPLLTDMQLVHEIIANGADITVQSYKVLAVELISSSQTVELNDSGRLDIGLIRTLITIE